MELVSILRRLWNATRLVSLLGIVHVKVLHFISWYWTGVGWLPGRLQNSAR